MGHGTGKGVLSACLFHEFDRCKGIELLSNLYNQSKLMQRQYEDFIKDVKDENLTLAVYQLPESSGDEGEGSAGSEPSMKVRAETTNVEHPSVKFPSFEVIQGDILEVDWSDSCLVLANSTCFDSALMNKIALKCSQLKKGSWMFTLTKRLPTAEPDNELGIVEWECVMSIKRQMSWGQATVHIHRKIV